PDAAAVAALDGDVRRVHPNDDALLAAEQDVLGVVHDLDAGDFILAGVVVADALAAAAGQAVVLDLGAAALALLGDGQDSGALAADGDTHHLVAFLQADGADAVAAAAHRPGVALIEADSLAVAGGDDQGVVAGGQAGPGD